MALVKLPKFFLNDHEDRDLPTPVVMKATKTHYFVRLQDPALPELLDDANYYTACIGRMTSETFGLCMSARATARAIKAAMKAAQEP
jgi:hypothetical protein